MSEFTILPTSGRSPLHVVLLPAHEFPCWAQRKMLVNALDRLPRWEELVHLDQLQKLRVASESTAILAAFRGSSTPCTLPIVVVKLHRYWGFLLVACAGVTKTSIPSFHCGVDRNILTRHDRSRFHMRVCFN